jgi:peroxiredoxin
MNADIVVGANFPDIELPDGEGKIHRLSAVQGDDPMAVIFYRGWF